MSLQWKLIAGAMYTELGLTILLLIPIISPRIWHKLFKSRFLTSIGNMMHIYIKAFIAGISLLLVDAIREMRKYTVELKEQHNSHHHDYETELHLEEKIFRAQRNIYITGFSLFLCFVLQRLMSIISRIAITEAGAEAAIAQAKSASTAAQQLLDQDNKQKESSNDNAQQTMTNVANEIKELREEKRKLEAERDFALKQAEGVKREYDQMLEKHIKLQEKLKPKATAPELEKLIN